jgi:Na+-driven multidrug efflux pump
VSLKKLKLHIPVLKKIVRVGIPAAVQMAITAFSNVFVQSYINHFGADCMGGWTAYAKIDAFLFLPMQSVAMGATTFVGQNLGVNDVDRARQGVGAALRIAMLITLCLMVPVIAFAPHLVRFFNDTPEVVRFGTLFLRRITPFYVLCCVNQVLAGSLRGAGDSRTPMFIMLFSFVIFRQIYLFIMTQFISNTILPVAMGYPAGWLVCSTITYLYYRFAHWEKHRIVE